jgi:hypothetical protein
MLVFLMETKSVLWEVRTETLYVIEIKFMIQRFNIHM